MRSWCSTFQYKWPVLQDFFHIFWKNFYWLNSFLYFVLLFRSINTRLHMATSSSLKSRLKDFILQGLALTTPHNVSHHSNPSPRTSIFGFFHSWHNTCFSVVCLPWLHSKYFMSRSISVSFTLVSLALGTGYTVYPTDTQYMLSEFNESKQSFWMKGVQRNIFFKKRLIMRVGFFYWHHVINKQSCQPGTILHPTASNSGIFGNTWRHFHISQHKDIE